jgi:hypothetical protein
LRSQAFGPLVFLLGPLVFLLGPLVFLFGPLSTRWDYDAGSVAPA